MSDVRAESLVHMDACVFYDHAARERLSERGRLMVSISSSLPKYLYRDFLISRSVSLRHSYLDFDIIT